MTDVLIYVSGHGFGHATRSAALIAALRTRAQHPLVIDVRGHAPSWIFTRRDPEVRCAALPVDVGALQPNGLDIDLPGTLAAHQAFAANWDAAVEREARVIRAAGAALVVGDVPPLALAAAARAGVPGVAVANFSWDWILEGWAAADPRWGPLAARYAEAYGASKVLFRLPLHGDLSAFPNPVDVPLLVNRSRVARATCRARLGIDPAETRRLVLVSFGGFGSSPLAASAVDDLGGYLFLGIGLRPPGFPGEWIALPSPYRERHEDLLHACDAIVGKPGYSTVAEAIAHHTRFLFLSRENFRENAVLEQGLRRHACAIAMPRDDFTNGRWRPHLDALFAQDPPESDLGTDGGEVIADALLRDFL